MLRSLSKMKSSRENVPSWPLRFIDDWNVRSDLLFVDKPVEIGRRPVCGVGSKPFRLDPEGRLGTLNHCPRGADLGLPDGARGFDIHNDPELDIDEIVVGVSEERRALHRASPLRSGVQRRDKHRRDRTGRAIGRILQRSQIFLGGPAGCFRIDSFCVSFHARNRAALVGIGLDQAGVHGKAVTADKAGRNTCPDNAFEHRTENIMIAETLVACTPEHRSNAESCPQCRSRRTSDRQG